MADAAALIAPIVEELEQLCARAERELVTLDWAGIHKTLSEQRRAIHALVNAVYATSGQRSPEFNARLRRRIDRIYAGRDHQLKRLVTYRDDCRQRLTMIARAKAARRTFGARPAASAGLLNTLT